MTKTNSFYLVLSLAILSFTACEKEEPGVNNGEELITTLNYELTATDNSETVTLTFKDLDGDGGNEPVITGGTLSANKTYNGAIELLNESESPVEDITEEVKEEDDEHQFFLSSDLSDISISYTDTDDNGNPVGLTTQVTTGAVSSGTMTIILRHQPDKSATGVSTGDISNAGGETDIEVTFPINVQ